MGGEGGEGWRGGGGVSEGTITRPRCFSSCQRKAFIQLRRPQSRLHAVRLEFAEAAGGVGGVGGGQRGFGAVGREVGVEKGGTGGVWH